MFKLVVLSVLVAVAVAKPAPGFLHGGLAIAPSIAYGAAVVGHIPTAVSHSSSSIIHSAALAAPVAFHAGPALVASPALAYGGGLGHLGNLGHLGHLGHLGLGYKFH